MNDIVNKKINIIYHNNIEIKYNVDDIIPRQILYNIDNPISYEFNSYFNNIYPKQLNNNINKDNICIDIKYFNDNVMILSITNIDNNNGSKIDNVVNYYIQINLKIDDEIINLIIE